MPAELERIVAHLCAVEDAVAERTEPLPWGTAVYHAGMPMVRETNVVRVEAHAPELRAEEVAAAVEERFGDRAYRNVEVLDAATGAALAPGLEAAGYATSRHLLMALDADPPRADGPVDEVAPDEVWPLREEWLRHEGAGPLAGALLAWERERARVTRARAFCARGEDRRPASMCLLMATAHAHEVELVYTTPAQRRRGLAYATVARAAAAAAAGDACTFLFTDAGGAAQHLYGRLGFHRAGLVHRFVRTEA